MLKFLARRLMWMAAGRAMGRKNTRNLRRARMASRLARRVLR